jgi:hypothetical protein
MRSIQHHDTKIHLPLFEWAERHRANPGSIRITRYRLDKWLTVHPVYEVPNHG